MEEKKLDSQGKSLKELTQIPGVGRSIARDLIGIGITRVNNLKNRDPESLYEKSNRRAGQVQDRCLLYVLRCAVYFASTKECDRSPEKLKWWNWKDGASASRRKIAVRRRTGS
ncbi:MAG TPA: helix-hairpin-helix domain-containing protein [Candidatus Kryptonia bacterium]